MTDKFQLDIQQIRRRAHEHMDKGAVTGAYAANKEQVLDVLNQALATEIVCVLRYKSHYYMARGVRGEVCAAAFLEHATDEQKHADLIASRIVQLGGTPDFNPTGLAARSHAEFRPAESARQMLTDDLIAERIAIDVYTSIARWLGDDDITSRRMMESLLADEEDHAEEISTLLQDVQ